MTLTAYIFNRRLALQRIELGQHSSSFHILLNIIYWVQGKLDRIDTKLVSISVDSWAWHVSQFLPQHKLQGLIEYQAKYSKH